MYLISVIVPVYNSEEYLENTITTVINQSLGFDNIELILVDDNSSDSSRQIIENYSEQFDNVVPYYSNKNHGFPGFGRNMGLKLASADYVMFLDNDDEYDKDICKKLYETITSENVDLVSCGRVLKDHLGEIKDNYHCNGGRISDNSIIFENEDCLSFCSITVWNKIFKKQIIDEYGLEFLEDSSADDFVFSVEYHAKSNKIIHFNDYFGYYWNIRNESLSHDIKLQHIEEVLNAYKYLVKKIKKENKLEYCDVILKHMVLLLVSKCSYLNVDFNVFKNMLKEIYDFEKDINFNLNLADKLFDFANRLILHKHFSLAILYLRFIKQIRKSSFLRKINRLKS